MVHKVNEIFPKQIFYLTKVLLKISEKDIKRKESQRSNPKNYLPEEAPKDMSLYESFDFSEGGIGVAKVKFSLKRIYYGWIFLTEFGGTNFAGFFPGGFFSQAQEKNTPEKNSQKLSQ